MTRKYLVLARGLALAGIAVSTMNPVLAQDGKLVKPLTFQFSTKQDAKASQPARDTLVRANDEPKRAAEEAQPITQAVIRQNVSPQQLSLAMAALKQTQGQGTGEQDPVQPPRQPNTPRRDAQANQEMNIEQNVGTNRSFTGISVESIPGTGGLIIRGPKDQVEMLSKLINQIDRIGEGAKVSVRLVPLENADSESLAKLLTNIYKARDDARSQSVTNEEGKVGFLSISRPNAVAIVAAGDLIPDIEKLVKKLDIESSGAPLQFKAFPLKKTPANDAASRINLFFSSNIGQLLGQQTQSQPGIDTAGLKPRVQAIADARTNTLIIYAGPDDLKTAEVLIKQFDGDTTAAVNDVKLFRLKHAIASELAAVLQNSLLVRANNVQQSTLQGLAAQPAAPQQQQQIGQQAGQQQTTPSATSVVTQQLKQTRLRLARAENSTEFVESGVLDDITINSDDRTNTLIVTADGESMKIIGEMIEQLDMSAYRERRTVVYRTKHLTGEQAESALRAFIANQAATRQFNANTGVNNANAGGQGLGAGGAQRNLQQRMQQEVVIVRVPERLGNRIPINDLTADAGFSQTGDGGGGGGGNLATSTTAAENQAVSNLLIISATPQFFDEVMSILEQIDSRPPQVMIQVMLAQVSIDNNEDFGLEFGVQSSVLYDRSLTVNGVTVPTAFGNATANNVLYPGFNFNSTGALPSPVGAAASEIGLQGLSNFALGRANSRLGYGGLILSAASDNISVLLRALKQQRRVDVLSRPQVMALDNQPAYVQVGERIFLAGNSTVTAGGATTSLQSLNLGIQLSVTPSVGPDGVVTMRVEPQIVARTGENTPTGAGATAGTTSGTAPVLSVTRESTTVSVADGSTAVIGGLITNNRAIEERKLPFIGDIPVLGWGFKTRFKTKTKQELIIILTRM